MKKKIAMITTLAITASSCVVLLTGAAGGGNTKATEVRVAALEKQSLEKTVSATGTVYSTQSTDVYSNFNYTVKTVGVRVGDKVSEGDVLCELDLSSLEADIEQKQAAVWAQQSAANQDLASAKSDLEIYKRNIENGNDSGLVNAQADLLVEKIIVHQVDAETIDVQFLMKGAFKNHIDLYDALSGMSAMNSETVGQTLIKVLNTVEQMTE